MTVSMEGKVLACHLQDEHSVSCNGTIYVLEEKKLTAQDSEFWLYVFGYIFCVLFAGLMSGLTIGLLSLDEISLNVLKEAGSPQQKKYAKRILPIVKRHHLLLVTLVLANSACVEAMPVCLDRVSGPITAILVSTTAVVLFGEVFPQALCTRFGLAIGAYMMPLVYTLMFLLFIVAWPIAKLLDLLLGKEHGTFYRRAELGVLVDLHADKAGGGEEGGEEKLTLDEVLIIKGALEMRDKTAKDAMVPLNDVFMLDINDKMDLLTMNKILTASHSRVPVYDGDKKNIIGVLLVKTLITLDPDDKVPIQSLKNTKSWRDVHYIEETKPLYDLLNEYQLGKAHLSVVLAKLDEEEIVSATTKQTLNPKM
ncbi:DUF21 domain-containing protein At4g33700 [Lingula anatina]|uniref:DUF21 domain-containing protein At4g33700 n=1 Tax=Lingula anatina TaxID=7574 RepID=A0A1S3IT72_LINAN|nr:DUF21 domain-containing protein At4g33700 [Lingula anatina]|eukprot:XP_013401397.1 DUF21 domain-containing protein At4g33700 [Lingula anatina]